VLEKHQRAARLENANAFRQTAGQVLDAAKHQSAHDMVSPAIRERNGLGSAFKQAHVSWTASLGH
jgi:hypothetical protein